MQEENMEDKMNSLSFLEKVFNITDYNRGKLGEVVKFHEEKGEGNWFFIQSSKAVTSAIIPLKELEEMVKAKSVLGQLTNFLLYQEALSRLNSSSEKIDFAEAMRKIGLDSDEVMSLANSVELE